MLYIVEECEPINYGVVLTYTDIIFTRREPINYGVVLTYIDIIFTRRQYI